jgi:hypothetical protein
MLLSSLRSTVPLGSPAHDQSVERVATHDERRKDEMRQHVRRALRALPAVGIMLVVLGGLVLSGSTGHASAHASAAPRLWQNGTTRAFTGEYVLSVSGPSPGAASGAGSGQNNLMGTSSVRAQWTSYQGSSGCFASHGTFSFTNGRGSLAFIFIARTCQQSDQGRWIIYRGTGKFAGAHGTGRLTGISSSSSAHSHLKGTVTLSP